MSKQSEAKKSQGYVPKATPQVCMNCTRLAVEKVDNGHGYIEDKNMRCIIGEFSVKKMGACDLFEMIF